jgi:beta-glucosidase
MRILNAPYLTVMMEGRYPEEYLRSQGANAPKFTPEELKTIGAKLDFVGANVYSPTYIAAHDNALGFIKAPSPASYPHMLSTWLSIGPEALYWAPHHLQHVWNVQEIYITENGASSTDKLMPDGHVYDTDRIMYLRNYLTQLQRAVSENVPVRGYFLWSLLDNFEWADGYTLRFGLYYVDYATQKRIPKLSASFYRETIARNAVS